MKFRRVLALTLVLLLGISIVGTALAYEVNCGSGGSAWSRTYSIYKLFGTKITMKRHSQGSYDAIIDTKTSYGKYNVTVKDQNGNTVYSNVVNLDKNSSVTLVGALKGTGTYKVTVSKATVPIKSFENCAWKTYPRYKLCW